MAGVFGLRGELKIAPTRIGDDTLAAGMTLHATLLDGAERAVRIRTLRRHKGRPLIAFEGVDDANAAAALVGATLTVARADVHLARGEYFDEDLIGCTLVDAQDGRALGEVTGVEHYPAQDVLRVDRRALVPLVRAFVQRVDVAAKRITVTLPPGLLDESQAEDA